MADTTDQAYTSRLTSRSTLQAMNTDIFCSSLNTFITSTGSKNDQAMFFWLYNNGKQCTVSKLKDRTEYRLLNPLLISSVSYFSLEGLKLCLASKAHKSTPVAMELRAGLPVFGFVSVSRSDTFHNWLVLVAEKKTNFAYHAHNTAKDQTLKLKTFRKYQCLCEGRTNFELVQKLLDNSDAGQEVHCP